MTAVVDLDPGRLAGLHWTFPERFGFARDLALVPLVGSEILRVVHDYPIGFARIEGGWEPVALLSGGPSRPNRYVDEDGRWRAAYIPFWLRMRPFVPHPGGLGVALDPRLVGASGAFPFVGPQGALSGAVENAARQIRLALMARKSLVEATTRLAEIAIDEGAQAGAPQDIRHLTDARVQAAIGPHLDRWLSDAPRAVELAIAAAFSMAHMPVRADGVALDEIARPAPPEPVAARPAAPDVAGYASPADLDWLDLGEKIAF